MVPLKEAIASAVTFARDLLGSEQTQGIRLEEVDSDEHAWFITPGVDSLNGPLAAFGGRRTYKILTVNTTTGEVTSMKIRDLAVA